MENTPSFETPGEGNGQAAEQSEQSSQANPPGEYGQPLSSEAPYSQAAGAPPPPPGGAYPAPPGYPPNPGQGYQGFPPPGGPQGPYGPYGAYPQPASAAPGFSFQAMLQRWQTVLTQPSVATFDGQQPSANWQAILISLLILGAVEAVANFITGLVARAGSVYVMPNGTALPVHVSPIGNAVGGLFAAFVGFFVLSGILYVSAKIFGGTGTFLMQSWLLSLFTVPLGIITAVAGIIPIAGGLVAFAAFVYEVFLAVLAMASAHRLSQGRAVAAVLLPIAVLVLLACAFAVLLAALLIAILHGRG